MLVSVEGFDPSHILVGWVRNLSDAVGGEPALDGSDVGSGGSSEGINFSLRQPLSVVGALRVGNVKELLLETLDVVLLQTNLSLDERTTVSLALRGPVSRHAGDVGEFGKRSMLLGRGSKHTDGSGGSKGDLGEGNHCEGTVG